MPNAKLNKWISLDYNRFDSTMLSTSSCASLPIKKRVYKNESECNTSGKKGVEEEEEVCGRAFT